jgi:hypothetical protein
MHLAWPKKHGRGRLLARQGLDVTSQTLWGQMLALHKTVLTPRLTRLMVYGSIKFGPSRA